MAGLFQPLHYPGAPLHPGHGADQHEPAQFIVHVVEPLELHQIQGGRAEHLPQVAADRHVEGETKEAVQKGGQ